MMNIADDRKPVPRPLAITSSVWRRMLNAPGSVNYQGDPAGYLAVALMRSLPKGAVTGGRLMDTMRLALSAKELAAIPDAPVVVTLPMCRGCRQTLADLRTAMVELRRDVAVLQAQFKGGPHEIPDSGTRSPDPY